MEIEVGEDWEKWKHSLARAVDMGEMVGISHQNIEKIAYTMGEFLHDRIDPANREQRVLADLWSVADSDERKNLASMIVKMVNKDQAKH